MNFTARRYYWHGEANTEPGIVTITKCYLNEVEVEIEPDWDYQTTYAIVPVKKGQSRPTRGRIVNKNDRREFWLVKHIVEFAGPFPAIKRYFEGL